MHHLLNQRSLRVPSMLDARIPLPSWFRNELRPLLETLRSEQRRVFEYVDHGTLLRLLGEHIAGHRDHSHYLWRILVLDLWLHRHPRFTMHTTS